MSDQKVFVLTTWCGALFDEDDIRIFSTEEKAEEAGKEFVASINSAFNPRYSVTEYILE